MAGLERADDGDQAGLDGAVHLGDPCLPGLLGLGDQLAGCVELVVVFGQELGGGDEQRAGQAPLTELSAMLPQFRARFRSLALACPRE
jgi:hypothetical protein